MEVLATKPNLLFVPKKEKEFEKKLKKKIGKKKQISNVGLNYMQGIKEIDDNHNYSNSLSLNLLIYARDKGISFKLMGVTSKEAWIIAMNDNEVKKVYFADGEEISKQKSVVGRGVAGALLAGPAGAVIGGLSGLGEVKQQEAFMVMEADDSKIIFKCDAGTKEIFERDFKNMFGDKVTTTSDLKLKQQQEKINNL